MFTHIFAYQAVGTLFIHFSETLFPVNDPDSTFLQVGSASISRSGSHRTHDGVWFLLPLPWSCGLGALFPVSQLSIQSLSLRASGDGDRGALVDIVHTPPYETSTHSPPGRGRRKEGWWTLLHVLIQWTLIYGVPVLFGLLLHWRCYTEYCYTDCQFH